MNSTRPPLGALIRGAVAGALGTAVMDMALFAKHRAQGGRDGLIEFEFRGTSDWDSVPAPALMGKRIYEGVLQRPLGARWARVTNNVMHWGYGISWGAALSAAIIARPTPAMIAGPVFGGTVWGSSYVILPLARLYMPIWKYRLAELAPDLAAHLAYGIATAASLRLLSSD